MIAARPDWVLSRQRAWGVPMTCFLRKGAKPTDADFLLRDPAVNDRIIAAFKADGADVWYMPGFKERILEGLHDPAAYDQVSDVLDVWFDSGSTHAFVLRDRPDGSADGIADLYLEGTDQHRGWFHSSMLQACGTLGRAPYRGVLTHGFTLDESRANVVGPGKRPFHTIIPAFLTRDGAPVMSFGVMGGDMQPQGHLQTLVRMLDYRQNPQAACDSPRWRFNAGIVNAEQGLAAAEGLRGLGHRVEPFADSYQDYGAGQFIWRLGDPAVDGYVAASDSRRDGHAAGY
jgi:hypothetical protein